jgi:hypothetical protein
MNSENEVPYERGGYLAPKVTRAENWTGKPEQVLPPREKGADPP